MIQSVMFGTLPQKSLIPVGRDYWRGSVDCLNAAYEWQFWTWTRLITTPKLQMCLPRILNLFVSVLNLRSMPSWLWKTPGSLRLGRTRAYFLNYNSHRISQKSKKLLFERLNARSSVAHSLMADLADEEVEEYLFWEAYQESNRSEEEADPDFADESQPASDYCEEDQTGEVTYLEMMMGAQISLYRLLYNKSNRESYIKPKLEIMYRKKIEFVELFFNFVLLCLISTLAAIRITVSWNRDRYQLLGFSCLGPYRQRIYPPLAPLAPPVLT